MFVLVVAAWLSLSVSLALLVCGCIVMRDSSRRQIVTSGQDLPLAAVVPAQAPLYVPPHWS